MLEKKRQDKIKIAAPLEKTTVEVLVANGRSVEPFIKVFTHSGENITKSPLGTLAGVFEIAEQSEDSAYIINFLASVAKKEYFNNPRRGAIESFEAALHKINLALAELVKHGNIAWLGRFHGALGVLEKNNFHFSVTGEAKILLLRNNNFSEISAGLASEESHVHPIKTFVEVSSGHLIAKDKIIFTSPELLDLLSLEDLEKNALRMDKDHFGQFLRTVLMNEFDMAGTICIDFHEGKPLPIPQKQGEKTEETTNNVFSQKAFIPKTKTGETPFSPKEADEKNVSPAEYIDSKTGHIYIQGNTPEKAETNQNIERIKLSFQNISHGIGSFFLSQGKLLRKGKKVSLILLTKATRNGHAVVRKTARFLRKQWKVLRTPKLPASQNNDAQPAQTREKISYSLSESEPFPVHPPSEPIIPDEREKEPLPATPLTPDSEIPSFMAEKLATFYQKNPTQKPAILSGKNPDNNLKSGALAFFSSSVEAAGRLFSSFSPFWERISSNVQPLFRRILLMVKNMSPKNRKISLGIGIACVIVIVGSLFFNNQPAPVAPAPKTVAPAPQIKTLTPPLATEKNVRLIENFSTLATETEPIIAALSLNDTPYLITEKNVVDIGSKKRYALPNGTGARLAAPMDHLSLIFIYTISGELLTWSPTNQAFTKNTLTLPEKAAVKNIGTYLTYLYVLDDTTDQIYRFPRAEGGFGPGVAWIKDKVTMENTAKMTVNETLFLAPNKNVIQAFSRGRLIKNIESPNIPLSLTDIYTHPGLANVYALDTQSKRVLVWNQDGVLLAQYFSEQLANAKTITVNEKTGDVFLTTTNSLLSFKISPER